MFALTDNLPPPDSIRGAHGIALSFLERQMTFPCFFLVQAGFAQLSIGHYRWNDSLGAHVSGIHRLVLVMAHVLGLRELVERTNTGVLLRVRHLGEVLELLVP